MKYLKTYEEIGAAMTTPFDSPKINSYSQQTPNGLGGTFNLANDTYIKDLPINNDNDFKRIARDMDNNKNVKKKKFNKKVKHFKNKK